MFSFALAFFARGLNKTFFLFSAVFVRASGAHCLGGAGGRGDAAAAPIGADYTAALYDRDSPKNGFTSYGQ